MTAFGFALAMVGFTLALGAHAEVAKLKKRITALETGRGDAGR
jgi:hypothetical protein